jgi:hypothetical protein
MSDNISYFYNALTGDEIENLSQGRIKRMSPYAAAGMIGSWMVETGSDDLSDLDVVERGNNNKGRGISQYTDVRRGPYDKARQEAINQGIDPNSAEFQFRYFVDEYMGKHDPPTGESLIGWTGSLENLPKFTSVTQAARHFTDNYFRPSTPHLDRRINSGETIFQRFGNGGPQTPKTQLSPIFDGKWVQKLGKKFGDNASIGTVFSKDPAKNAKLMSKLDKRAAKALGDIYDFQQGRGDKKLTKKGWKYLEKTGISNFAGAFGINDKRSLVQSINNGSAFKMPSALTTFNPSDIYKQNSNFSEALNAQYERLGSIGSQMGKLFVDKSNSYGTKAFELSTKNVADINNRAYADAGSREAISDAAGVYGGAAQTKAAEGGNDYGEKAMNMDTTTINQAAYGSSQPNLAG